MKMATSGTLINHLEDNIRVLVQTKRVRVSEFFQDFDQLRSGFVTKDQFFRCLWQTLGVQLTDAEEHMLIRKYDLKHTGEVNYKAFCSMIQQNFRPEDVRTDPMLQTVEAKEFLGTSRSVRPISPGSESRLQRLLQHMESFYAYHGINLRTCFEDFDKHHIGIVTESQFYRSFPGPPDVTESDMTLLVRKYQDPERSGLINYLNLHHDVVAIGELMAEELGLRMVPQRNIDDVPSLPGIEPSLKQIFDKIQIAVYKNGIRTSEFFKDHDSLRCGIITENQFVCGLALAVGKEAQLSRSDIQKVVEYYKRPDGRVYYKEFCDIMENAFNMPDLEKRPTETVTRPPRGTLSRTLKPLNEVEEGRIRVILGELSDHVRRRRLMMYPYFKDYDRGVAYTRVVTRTQFGRILHFLSLTVAGDDLQLICRKFEEPSSGDVNYPAFVQAVDKEFVGHTLEDVAKAAESIATSKEFSPEKRELTTNVSMDDLIGRIRHIVLTSRLRVSEYFEDYDPLRTGSISKTQFRRGLGLLGLSKLGAHDLSNSQFDRLCQHYENPAKIDQVLWTHFLWDIESVFTQPNLESMPMFKVPVPDTFLQPKPGTVPWEQASSDHSQLVADTMDRLCQRAKQRRLHAKPVFQDFDRHNNGHVTRPQFRQCFTILELRVSEAETNALEAKFCNDLGFDYMAFLRELEPPVEQKMMYIERLEELRRTNQRPVPAQTGCSSDLDEVLLKVKTKVIKERIRALEFMRDYDKLRSGRMLKTSFRRALDLCRFELKNSEIDILEDKYQTPNDPDYVNYLQFCDVIESVFTTKHLEKAPLLEVHQFKPPVEWELNQLSPRADKMLTLCFARLAKKVRQGSIQLFPLFEDYDRVHNGSVSRSQFRRVLSELELGSLVSEQELELLYKKFDVQIGGKDDVNYIAFCDFIYQLAHFDKRMP